MGSLAAILMLASPVVLVVAAYLALPAKWARILTLVCLALVWTLTAWLWIDYNRQTDDVGIMITGIMAAALSASAAVATLAALYFARRG